jgi:cell wall-associated NlpC family hydrolase
VHHLPAAPRWEPLLAEAGRYLHAPYFWGGRTLWGIDCSGLVQTLLQHQGIGIQRDCLTQVDEGAAVPSLPEALPGDLAFFDGTRDGGRHVGLVLGGGEVLHSSGFVRVDALTARGIVVRETGHLSHRLTALRRVTAWSGFGS